MEQLEQIPIGQQANDGTGDPLRNGMAKVNDNFTKVQTGVDAVELTAVQAAQTASEAKTTADAAIPAAQKGMAGGVAPLDASGKVPAAHLPELADYIPVEEKGAAGGVAPLGADGKVPAINLPAAEDSIPLSQKGQPGGVATLDTGGKVPAGQLPPIPTGPPAGSVAWWPLRTSIPAGQIPADGQTVSRATFPDLAAMVAAGTVPVVAEADWLADPLKRGAYTLGNGSTTIRVPDLNGKSSGSIGAPFLRGDGLLYSVSNGLIKASQNKAHLHSFQSPQYLNGETGGTNSFLGTLSTVTPIFTRQTASEGGAEAHPTFVSGVWTIQAFGTVTNPGSVDAAQLASDYAALNAAFQTQLAFTIIYPNGGTETAPAPVAVNTRYVLANPFPGSYVICEAQLKYTDGWCSTGWFTQQSASYGTRASQLDRGNIIVRTGVSGATASPDGAGQATVGTLLSPIQSRVLVWKCKG